ncbi:MAG: acyltransferase [Bacteroidales bacterium]|nr:acyltransferase [Bacteroidales bacterium]
MKLDKDFSVIDYDDLQSKVMDWLRFPLMVAICFIHIDHQLFISMNPSTATYSVYFLISQILAKLAVPLFFIISGYYFFYNKNGKKTLLNKEIYISKLRKRVHTLLIPYLFWNALLLCLYLANLYYENHTLLSPLQILKEFVSHKGSSMPVAFQFWFIRDLMFLSIISPILYFTIRKGKLVTILLLSIFWIFQIDLKVLDNVSLFYFSLGAFFSINGRNIIKDVMRLPNLFLYIVVIELLLMDWFANCPPTNTVHTAVNEVYLHHTFILFGVISVLKLVAWCFKTGKLQNVNKRLSNASFFLFAIHPLLLVNIFNRLPLKFLPHNDFTFLLVYLLSVPAVSICAVWLYNLLKKYFPNFTSIITGGR